MKKFICYAATLMLTIMVSAHAFAQDSFAYQAVIRNAKGELITDTDIEVRFSLTHGGKDYYVETQKVKTNKYGNIQVEVGKGTRQSGAMDNVPWSTFDVSIKVEVSTNNKDFTTLGETKIAAVPYAMYAANGGSVLQAGATKDSENLFEVTDRDGNTVFAVTPNGIVVYVDDSGKAARSGFIVTGRTATKAGQTNDYFAVTADGTKVYIDDDPDSYRDGDKAARSGFLVSGRTATKAGSDADNEKSGRDDAAKTADADLFAIDGALTTVYVDDTDSNRDKAARSGFVVTGRTATKGEPINYVDVSGSATTLITETLTVSEPVKISDPTAPAPTPTLTIANKQVEMKSDVVMSGDVLPTTEFEGKKADFEINLAFYQSTQILVDSLLKWGGETDKKIDMGQFGAPGHLKYVFDGNYLVDAQPMNDYNNILCLDASGNKNYDWENMALQIRIYGEYGKEYVQFMACCSTAVKMPIQFALSYTDSEEQQHDIMFTVNVTIDQMLYPYGIEKGTAKYAYVDKDANKETIDYCFYDYGWDNYEGFYNGEGDDIHGKYNHIVRVDRRLSYFPESEVGIDARSDAWSWTTFPSDSWSVESGGAESHIGDMTCPLFSLAGVNTSVYLTHLGTWGGSLTRASYETSFNAPMSVGQDTVMIGGNTYNVEKIEYLMRDDSNNVKIFTFYVFKGIVLKIDSRYQTSTENSTILRCLEFKPGEAETSFHRWLKNSGVTNYDGIASFNCQTQIDGHPYIDLDLPSGNLWAATNVGALTPYDWGDYLAWGEFEEKSSYTQSGYSVTELNNSNDAAYQWGYDDKTMTSQFCMPTKADWQELADECLWVCVKGEGGVRIYSTTEFPQNKGEIMYVDFDELEHPHQHGGSDEVFRILDGQYLFLPAAGFYNGQMLTNYANTVAEMQGYYWSSTTTNDGAECFAFGSTYKQMRANSTFQGLQVRAVAHKGKTVYINSEASDNGDGTEGSPYKSLALAKRNLNDQYMNYTFKMKGEFAQLDLADGTFRKLILEGQSGFESGTPKDKIKGNYNTRPLTVNGGTVIIKNLLITGGGVPANQNESCHMERGGGIYVGSTAIVELESGAHVMYNQACSTGTAVYGGGVFIDYYYDENNWTEYRGKLVMREGSVVGNNTVGKDGCSFIVGGGAGIYNNGELEMYGGTISNNTACGYDYAYDDDNTITYFGMNGGGVYVGPKGKLNMYGGTITENKINAVGIANVKVVEGFGSGVYYSGSSSNSNGLITMTGGEISGNTAPDVSDVYLGGSQFALPFTIAGNAYVENFYLAIVGNDLENISNYFIQVDDLSTNRVMNVTCASGNGVAALSTTNLQGTFKVLYHSYDKSVITKAINLFNVTNTGYKIEYEYIGWEHIGVLKKE